MLDRMQRLRRGAVTAVGMAAAVVVLASCGAHGPHEPPEHAAPGGPGRAARSSTCSTPFFWVAVVIGAASSAMTIFVALRFREKPGEERNPVQTHGNIVLEVSWTIIPFLILAVMAVPTVATIFNLAKIPHGPERRPRRRSTPASGSGSTCTPTRAPGSTRPTRCTSRSTGRSMLTLKSNNVIHSFWVPELAGKKDVVPGHTNNLDDRGRASPARSPGSAPSTAASRTPTCACA